MPIINILQPVVWADGIPTTATYRRRKYRLNASTPHERYAAGLLALLGQLEKLGVTELVHITINMKTSPIGDPIGPDCEPDDVRASIVFDLPNGDRCIIGTDAYKTTGGNLAALGKIVGALLEINKHGPLGALLNALRAYTVTKKQPPPPPRGGNPWRSGPRTEDWYSTPASNRGFYDPPLPPPPPPPPQPSRGLPWWVVLEVMRSAEADTVLRCYRAMAMRHHPDRGGKAEDMQAINNAYAAFKQERGIK